MAPLNFRRNIKYWLVVGVLLTVDLLAGWFAMSQTIFQSSSLSQSELWILFVMVQAVWAILFYANSRYRVDPTLSRFREIQSLLKITLAAVILAILFNEMFPSRLGMESAILLTYWFYLVTGLTVGRLAVRRVQKAFMVRGYGKKKTVIIGTDTRAQDIADHLVAESSGYDLVGFVKSNADDVTESEVNGTFPVLGSMRNIRRIIDDYHVNEVVIALEKPDHNRLLNMLTQTNGAPVSLRIIPDMYEVISGLAKTEELYGLPLVDINPEILTVQQKIAKRLIDMIVSLAVMVPLLPIWIIVSAAIKIESSGPVLYRQERVGQNGKVFLINKFRSMVHQAETMTGPVWAEESDPRITGMGRLLRRFRLDEVPQFINVFLGHMSVIGPRPERPYFVQKLMEEFPFYYRRHKIRPGISGWAQIKHSYDSSISDVRQKLKYDFFYIENMSLSLDFLIMFRTVLVMLSGKGQ